MKTFQKKMLPSKMGRHSSEIQSYTAVNDEKPEFLTELNSHILEKPEGETLFKKKGE